MIVLGQIRTYARRALWTMDCNQATKTYRHQLVYQSPWPKCQLKDMYIKMIKKTVKSLNTIDSKSFELHDIISFNKPTTLEYPVRITRITYRL